MYSLRTQHVLITYSTCTHHAPNMYLSRTQHVLITHSTCTNYARNKYLSRNHLITHTPRIHFINRHASDTPGLFFHYQVKTPKQLIRVYNLGPTNVPPPSSSVTNNGSNMPSILREGRGLLSLHAKKLGGTRITL